jgi:hypothetical protein
MRYMMERGYLGDCAGNFDTRDEVLSGSGMLLAAQLDGGHCELSDFVGFFCALISENRLKPWGRVGRRFLRDAVSELVATGSYDCQHTCWGCHCNFWIMPRETIATEYDDGHIEKLLGIYRAHLIAPTTDGSDQYDDGEIVRRLEKYREELKGRQSRIVKDYDDAVIDELIKVWRGKVELRCDACKQRVSA